MITGLGIIKIERKKEKKSNEKEEKAKKGKKGKIEIRGEKDFVGI